MNSVTAGAVAGLAATGPMTLAMLAMHRVLPRNEQYELPPEEITEVAAHRAGAHQAVDEDGERRGLALALHFGFGAAAGALYPLGARGLPLPHWASGTVYAMGVWAGAYLGLFPAARILRPATEHPPRRTALMIAAHIVWGSVLGVLYQRLSEER